MPYRISSRPTNRGISTEQIFFAKDKPNVGLDKFIISWEWTAIPVVLRPGDKIPMTLRGTVAEHPTGKNGFVGLYYPYLKVEFWRPKPGPWGLIGGFTPAIIKFSTGDPKVKTGLARTEGTVPPGGEGQQLALVVVINHSERHNRQYVYNWAAGPFPTKVPDPIPASQTSIDGDPPRDRDPEPRPDDADRTDLPDPDRRDQDDDPLRNQPAGMTLQADRRTVKVGGSVTVPVRILNARNVGNLDFKVTFDPAVVRPQGKALRGNILGDAGMQSNPADRGRVWIAFATAGSINGDGTVVQLPFEAVGRPGDKTVLGLEVTMFNDSADTSSITKIPGEIEILTAKGRIPGDLNNNRIIDAGDALDALKMAVRLIPMDLDADMDNDGTVTSADARILLRKALER
jgi:hypothetical protein